jgi:hypothetical protein
MVLIDPLRGNHMAFIADDKTCLPLTYRTELSFLP